ncbi:hypothetical protein IRZ83_01440 [Flavobacterium sp. JLP]|uniref:hypothetical protein n=1 Tax=unclassified Flavobacterium TaxID=196869 RepID=UPI00188AE453|nr:MULTISPECIES: hypothetical protein [unclassified Flavobacterium]MBF4491189.1 hypothetical protein [Flavobacterium sp. MR2016-29]MBF4505310.1 hypothetical protein [Flavobacterium sp. JLP]
MTNLNHKNTGASSRTSDKKPAIKPASSRTNEKFSSEIKKSVLPGNISEHY